MDDLIFDGWNSIKWIRFRRICQYTAKADQHNDGQIVYKSHLLLQHTAWFVSIHRRIQQATRCEISPSRMDATQCFELGYIKHSVHIRVHNPWQWTNIELLTIFKVKFLYVIRYRETNHIFFSVSSSDNKNRKIFEVKVMHRYEIGRWSEANRN